MPITNRRQRAGLALLVLWCGCSTLPAAAPPQPSATTTSGFETERVGASVEWTFESGSLPPGFVREETLPESLVACAPVSSEREELLPGLATTEEVARKHGRGLARLGGDYWVHPLDIRQEGKCRFDSGATGSGGNGRVVSPAFQVSFPYLGFLTGGGGGELTSVELCIQEGNDCLSVMVEHGKRALPMVRTLWDLRPFQGKRARIRIADRSGGASPSYQGRRFLLVDDIRSFAARPPPSPPPPVWGFADLHAHFLNHLCCGGMLYGDVQKSMKDGLRSCDAAHARGVITSEGLIGNFNHVRAGYPRFPEWPRHSTKAHQQAHVEWIKRAWRGGLRLVQLDAGNSRTFGDAYKYFSRLQDVIPYDDKSVLANELAGAKNLETYAESWFKIVRSPAEAREAIGQGKLAVVLGVEMDDPEEPFRSELERTPHLPEEVARPKIRQYVEDLQKRGVRHYFPVHVVENVFGTPAVYAQILYATSLRQHHTYIAVKNGFDEGVRYRLVEDPMEGGRLGSWFLQEMRRWDPLLLTPLRSGGARSVASATPVDAAGRPEGLSSMAKGGLSRYGEILVQELMRAGMMIDLTHMSQVARGETIRLASSTGGYPLMASHTGFRDLAFGAKINGSGADYTATQPAISFRASDKNSKEQYGTSLVTRVASEAALTKDEIGAILQSGGIIGLGLGGDGDGVEWQSSRKVHVPLDCDGSAKSFAQRYLFSLDVLRREGIPRGIALGTDIDGFAGLPPPRFGNEACALARTDTERGRRKDGTRGKGEQAQSAPVLYDTPLPPARARLIDAVAAGPSPQRVPLVRSVVEDEGHNPVGREFDVNLDGVAHYGMLPDFLQDLVNVGIPSEDLAPLFQGAEDYIQMWEKIEALAAEVKRQVP